MYLLYFPHLHLDKAMISADLLRRLRNDLPMPVTIAALGRAGPPSKISEGYFRFLCPRCGEMRVTVNPRNNLAHCFCCKHNLNNIDLLLTLDYDFLRRRRSSGALAQALPGPAGEQEKSAPAGPHVIRYRRSVTCLATRTSRKDRSSPAGRAVLLAPRRAW